ncbi:MAG: helix-turn-helix domain-containing protein [Candidatus Aenigmarchaeota archaeon]|nr:helix-turn-helix domain-containing protein [Candidatus Aenigmarchaeota archaeon]
MKACKFRIYPAREQDKQMSLHLNISKGIWDDVLGYTIKTYEETKNPRRSVNCTVTLVEMGR